MTRKRQYEIIKWKMTCLPATSTSKNICVRTQDLNKVTTTFETKKQNKMLLVLI